MSDIPLDEEPRKRRRWPIVVGAIAVVALVAGVVFAVTRPQTTEASAQAAGEPVQGGTLVYSDVQPITDLKWTFYTVTNYLANVTDTLVYLGTDGKIVPYLADSWTVSEDGLDYSFTLRDGVTFSDGTPLTAAVVARNLDVFGLGDAATNVPSRQTFSTYESTEVTDDTHFVVHLKSPDSAFLYTLTQPYQGIYADATLDLPYDDQAKVSNVVGTGAYVFESEVPDQEITLAKRADYAWPPAGSANQGAAYLDTIEFRNISEVGLRAGAVTSGQVDVARGIQPSDEATITAAGDNLIRTTVPISSSNYGAFRIVDPVVADKDVRLALQKGIDRDALVKTVLTDSYQPAASIFGHDFPDGGFLDLSDEISYDPDEANRLLDQAGWTGRDSEGFRTKDGQRLSVTIAASAQSVAIKPAFEFIENEWRQELGVELTNLTGDTTAYNAALKDPSYTLLGSRGAFNLFLSGLVSQNFYDDPVLSQKLDAVKSATTTDAFNTALDDIQRYLTVDQALTLVVYDEAQVQASGSGVHIDFDGWTSPKFQSAWKDAANR
jgi:peptide/nickel transport system substrate-binding protein